MRWTTEDGWTVEAIQLVLVSKTGDTEHDLHLVPDHDGEWFRVVQPSGFLGGYVDSVESLYEHFPHLRGALREE